MAINAETYTYDFSSNSNWVTTSGGSTAVGVGSTNKLNAFYYKNTGECFNAGGKGYFNSGYFLWGKSGAYIEVPTFDGEKITNITAHSSSGHSTSVNVNVFTSNGEIASTEITWATTSSDYSYDIKDEYQSSVLRLQVTNSKNSQLTKLTITTVATSGEVVETVAKPVISPASGEITADTEISIECATEDATIKYTIDGTEPSAENGTIYTAPFTLNVDATVKAIAIKDGYNNSAVATATYTLFVSSEYSYELVTSVENGGHYIIVGEKDGNYFAMGAKRDGKNNRESIDVTLDENGAITKPSVKVSEIELQGSEGAWNLYSPNENAYLYNDNGGSNKLILSSESTEMTKATITFNETTAVITFINVTGATADNNGIITQANILQYNSSSNIFSCYKGTQLPIYLYQRVGDVPTGIEDTMVDENAPVEYYNLQGVKVANPVGGIFIKKQGGRTSKVVL